MCAAICAVLGVVFTIGCASKPEPLPTLADVRASGQTLERYEPPPLSTAPRAEAQLQIIGYPIDADLSDAWSLVDTDEFPAMTRGVWLANGIQLGVIHRVKLAEMLSKLPDSVSQSRTRLIGYDVPTPVRRSPRLLGEFYADLTVPPFARKREAFTGGRLQLLTRLIPETGYVMTELTPHHYRPKLTLEPRTAMEKELDGRVFDELTVRVAMPADRVLVLGYALPSDARVPQRIEPGLPGDPTAPQAPVDPATPLTPGGSAALQPVRATLGQTVPTPPQRTAQSVAPLLRDKAQEPLPPVDEAALPLNLGRGLLTTPGKGGTVQLLILVTVAPTGD